MARRGRVDRGLVMKRDAAGKVVWMVRMYHERRDRTFGSFKTKTQARAFYEKAKQEQTVGQFFPERYQQGGFELVKDMIDRYRLTFPTKKPKTQLAYEYFATWWSQRFEGQRLNAITPTALEDARRWLLKTPRPKTNENDGKPDRFRTPARVNRYLAFMRQALNIAVREGKMPSNPVLKMKAFKESAGKTRFLSMEDEAKLLAALGPVYGPWARLAILTGMRQAEQFSLRWADVDLERGILTLPTTKAGGVQYVFLNDEAKEILRGFDSWERSVWVFPSRNPATHLAPDNVMDKYRAAVKRAGIEWVTWHDLRHTFASRLAMDGQAEGTIAALLRHSTTALVRRYAHLSPSHLKAAVEGVSAFGRRKPEAEAVPVKEPNGTVTETVTEGGEAEKREAVSD